MKRPYINDCNRGCRKQQNEQAEWQVEMHQGCCKLSDYNWLKDIPATNDQAILEVRFKNTHKGYYRNVHDLSLSVGDIVAVESAAGHDVGIINMEGPLVWRQLARNNIDPATAGFRKIYRKAKSFDIERWQEAIAREHTTMIAARQIAARMRLNMKIGDVEFQGDGSKAIFYYIADERVDFRELIKQFADEFHIRIEMRQIGARQEAGLIGGLGICGRELCCSQWMAGFTTVNANAARWQDIALNPQKLTGQCSKLKCCLNHEVSTYMDAQKDFPNVKAPLETEDGQLFLQKTDILKGLMYFSNDASGAGEYTEIPVTHVKEIIALNKRGTKVPGMTPNAAKPVVVTDFKSAVGEDSITRFDKKKKARHSRGRNNRRPSRPAKQSKSNE